MKYLRVAQFHLLNSIQLIVFLDTRESENFRVWFLFNIEFSIKTTDLSSI